MHQQLRAAILTGLLAAGQTVPSTRAMAATCSVSRGSIVSVYEDLIGEGYLISKHGSGTVVAEGASSTLGVHATSAGMSPTRSRKATSSPSVDVLDLRPGYPTTDRLAHADWRAAWRFAAATDQKSGDPDLAGDLQLRTELSRHLHVARGLRCDPDDVFVSAGTSDALGLIFATLNPPDSVASPIIAVEDPGYPTAWAIARRARIQVVPIAVDGDGIDVQALHRHPDVSAVLVTPSHQYPLGGRLNIADRLALLDWAAETHSYVIEDDYDSEFRYVGSPLPSIAALDQAGNVLLVGSLSKVLSPHVRCGYIVLPSRNSEMGERMRQGLLATRRDMGMPVPGILQTALARYIADGGLRRHIARTRRNYVHKRALVLQHLGNLPNTRLSALEGGIHAVLEIAPSVSSQELAAKLRSCGVLVDELAEHSLSQPSPLNGLVIGYGSTPDMELVRGLELIRGGAMQQPGGATRNIHGKWQATKKSRPE